MIVRTASIVARGLPVLLLAGVAWHLLAAERVLPPGPRGKPIRPPAGQRTGAVPPLTNIITLPGGVVITNIPGEFLPRSTNSVRLPSAAARRFQRHGYHPISFIELARFIVKVPEPGAPASTSWNAVREQIPPEVLALDGKKIALAGFTLPITLVNGRATEFLLLRTQAACCFGMVPRINEIVIVKMAPPGLAPELDVPMVVGGVLQLKWIGEAGQLSAIYELHADRAERAYP
jgi:hypothetical protein